jgi:hypothetical protein
MSTGVTDESGPVLRGLTTNKSSRRRSARIEESIALALRGITGEVTNGS